MVPADSIASISTILSQPQTREPSGAVGAEQLAWLDAELGEAEAMGEAAVVLCHFPVLGSPGHVLWNAEEVLGVLDRHPSVVAWLNGHDHAGGHVERGGVHHLTFQGMVDTDENAYALVQLTADRLRVRGFGREPDRELALRARPSAAAR